MKIQIHTQTHIQTQTSTGELHVVLRHLTLFPKNLEVLLMCIIYAYVLNLEAYLCVVELFITIIICMCVCVFYRTNEIYK